MNMRLLGAALLIFTLMSMATPIPVGSGPVHLSLEPAVRSEKVPLGEYEYLPLTKLNPKKKTKKKVAADPVKTMQRAQATSRTPQQILDAMIARHPILRGATAVYGDAGGYQAVAYYTRGRIVVDRAHTRSLDVIITHEAWHIIDWRDNHRIDWGENVPR